MTHCCTCTSVSSLVGGPPKHHSPDAFLPRKPSPSPSFQTSHRVLSFPFLLPPVSLSLTWTTALASKSVYSSYPSNPLFTLQRSDHVTPLLKHFHWLLYPQGEVCLTWHSAFHDLAAAWRFSLLAFPPNEITCCFPKAHHMFFSGLQAFALAVFYAWTTLPHQVFIEHVVSAWSWEWRGEQGRREPSPQRLVEERDKKCLHTIINYKHTWWAFVKVYRKCQRRLQKV